MTGLPASGKTRAGCALAEGLGWPCLDKDDFLEALFERQRVADLSARRRLSQQSDASFREAAVRHSRVVLISHWAPKDGDGSTGTSTDWIMERFERVIELHCMCSPHIAAGRFVARRRHPGHLDQLRSVVEIERWMQALAEGYPLGLGKGLAIRTDQRCDGAVLLGQVRSLLVA